MNINTESFTTGSLSPQQVAGAYQVAAGGMASNIDGSCEYIE